MTARPVGGMLHRSAILAVVDHGRSRNRRSLLYMAVGLTAVFVSLAYCGALDSRHYSGAVQRFATISAEAFPPDFARWRSWALPLLETLTMSIASTLISSVVALVL